MRPFILRLLPILTLPLIGCPYYELENEEEITVHSDGSVAVTITARGQTPDLSGGYPVPLHAPWVAAGDDTALWLREIGPSTGGAATVELVRKKQRALWGEGAFSVELSARAVFPAVADLPQFLAPRDASHRSAYLARETTHEVRELDDRRVHLFERTYGLRDHRRFDPTARMESAASEELKAAMEENSVETFVDRWPEIVELMRAAMIDTAEDLTRDALHSIYTEGDANLALVNLESIADVVRGRAALVVTKASVEEVGRFFEENDIRLDPDDLEGDVFESVRRSLAGELPRLGVDEDAVMAVLAHLEGRRAAMRYDNDLVDDTFRVLLRLPGTIVGGNYDALDETGRAIWDFKGSELLESRLRLHAVSVER